MSAFVMLTEGFNTLANELATRAEHSNNVCDLNHAVARNVREFLGLGWETPSEERANKAAFDVVQALYNTNVVAVCRRYGHMTDDDRPTGYGQPVFARVNYWPQWSAVQLLKHLQCLRYQMSEGEIPETRIYAKLSELINDIALSIATHTPEYEKAKWDFEPQGAQRRVGSTA